MKHFILNQIQQHSSEMPNAATTDKYFVVVGVIAVLFVGIVAFLVHLERRIKKQETEK